MIACHCEAVSDRTVRAAISSGADSVAAVTARCRAGGGCGGCHQLLQSLVDATSSFDRETADASAA
jgi:bacterioferritin-associated ferredoxin